MDDASLTRLIGLAALALVFAVTVLLMPWIFGDNPPPENADAPAPVGPPDRAAVSEPDRRDVSLKQ